MSFSPAGLLPFIARLARAPRYLVAYSGGVDSHALLHALVQLRAQFPGVELGAIHVNHGLQLSSTEWAQHCVQVCAELGVACEVRAVDARALVGTSPEDAARVARYTVFTGLLQPGDVLFTAHHQDDQAETLLLQLLRGAGPRGLAGMAELSRFAHGWLARPLLECSRAALREYALAQQLHWIDDPSNSDTRFDRNYLRHEILPRLQRRWPAASVTLARSAQLCAEAAEVLEVSARADLHAVAIPPTPALAIAELAKRNTGLLPPPAGKGSGLSVSKLLCLSPARQRNVLRFWIEQLGLPLPQQRHLERLQRDVLHAAADAEPRMHWPGADVRRYRDALYALPPVPGFDASQQWTWNLDAPLHIAGAGTLAPRREQGAGLRAEACAAGVRVAFRSGGERIRPAGRAHHATLKNLFQQAGVPPWQRARVPLLYIGTELAAVAGYWYADEFAARDGAVAIEFQPE
ncbi:MAG: tRNA lysidine(34) synthetase TilS [Gammaproteobacteria bacterium]|nr:tRNA lysidine(34) synthetase TilS [Gammaproteobacteria bacterium]